MADPSDMLHKPKKIAEPTVFPLLVWALCQSWHLKTCQSASLFVSRRFQRNDSQVLTLRRPVCQLRPSLCIWPAFLPVLAQEKPLGEAPLLTWPLGKSSVLPVSVLPRWFSSPDLSLQQGLHGGNLRWKRAGRQSWAKSEWQASLFLLRCTVHLEWLEGFPPWAPVGTEVGKKKWPYSSAILCCLSLGNIFVSRITQVTLE